MISTILPKQLYLSEDIDAALLKDTSVVKVSVTEPYTKKELDSFTDFTSEEKKALQNFKPDYTFEMNMEDSKENLAQMQKAVNAIDQNINAGKKVLVFCHLGQSRSPSVVLSYLTQKRGIRTDDALKLIQKARPVANPPPSLYSAIERAQRSAK